ncbi:hypothetical protein DRW41_06045 [Neobacillus piezotolerans]|uniref:Uncharacterized protein n=1 Tax=Neobacillus piezotolerans TaxID=2259171 RepID=A0A3D8GSH1_9BACI|nr:hypothetical protein DRW41_06045 [Neobacillus piezotolerans]
MQKMGLAHVPTNFAACLNLFFAGIVGVKKQVTPPPKKAVDIDGKKSRSALLAPISLRWARMIGLPSGGNRLRG